MANVTALRKRAPEPRVPMHVQAFVAAAVAEALSLRRRMTDFAFERDVQGQSLVAYVKGCALGLGIDHHDLVAVVRPLIEEGDLDALWTRPS